MTTRPDRKRRRGYTFLEVQVAFLLLGIGLAGVCPLVVMQLKLARKIDQGYNPLNANFHGTAPGAGVVPFYVVPPGSSWARKLGVSASLSTTPPTPAGAEPLPGHAVTINAFTATPGTDSVTLQVTVSP